MHKPLLVTLAPFIVGGLPAHAGRPLQAEDAGILDRGTCEVEAAAERLRTPGAPQATGSSLQLACGVGAASQVALQLARSRSAGASADGLRLGGKSELWKDTGDGAAAFTVAWGVVGEKASGASWRHAGTELNGVLSVPGVGATWHLNLGHARDEAGHTRTTTWAVAWERDALGAWAPMGELFGDDRGAPWWNLGLRFTARPERLFFDLSYGRQITTGRPSLLTVGFKSVF